MDSALDGSLPLRPNLQIKTVPIKPANNSVTNNQTGAFFEAYKIPVLKPILNHIKQIEVIRALVVIDSDPSRYGR